jgi:CBS domain-containing protein
MFAVNATADQIMSAPVITVTVNRSVAEIQLLMMQHNIVICVTSDGTPESEIIGIISEHDVFTAQANNPGVLVKQTKERKLHLNSK